LSEYILTCSSYTCVQWKLADNSGWEAVALQARIWLGQQA